MKDQKRGRDTEMVQDPENLRPLKGNWNLRRWPQGNTGISYKILSGCSMAVLPCPFHEESHEIDSQEKAVVCYADRKAGP